jgi:hypothetical protein
MLLLLLLLVVLLLLAPPVLLATVLTHAQCRETHLAMDHIFCPRFCILTTICPHLPVPTHAAAIHCLVMLHDLQQT